MPTAIQLAKRGLEGSTVTVCSITTGGWTMSCSTALSWGAALSSRATGGVAGWTPVVRHRRLSGALSALSLSVWSGVDFWRIAARRPRSAGGVLPDVVPGDASAGGVASPLSGVAARRAGAVWRGGLQRRSGPAEVPARQLGCAIPRCISSTRKCASRAACSLSISAAIRISTTAWMVWCWWISPT